VSGSLEQQQALDATQREALAESIVAQREASEGRAFDPVYRSTMKRDLAALSIGELDSLVAAGGRSRARSGVEPDLPGDTGADLVYTPVTPCRIFDTRLGGGPIAANTQRNFYVAGTGGFPAQGGNAGGCGIPYGAATSVIVNFAVVNVAGAGNLRAWAVASPQPAAPTASVLNYGNVAGLVALANGIAVPICDPAVTSCVAGDLRLQADVSGTNVVADVVGYFRSFNTATTRLQSGQTVFGSIGARYNVPSALEVAGNSSLPVRAPVALDSAHVQVAGVDSNPGECPGSAAAPSAAPGFVCMYPFYTLNATVNGGYIWGGGTSREGFQISWNSGAAGATAFFANWAYTAP
jgi:hypothetical protein